MQFVVSLFRLHFHPFTCIELKSEGSLGRQLWKLQFALKMPSTSSSVEKPFCRNCCRDCDAAWVGSVESVLIVVLSGLCILMFNALCFINSYYRWVKSISMHCFLSLAFCGCACFKLQILNICPLIVIKNKINFTIT